MLQSLKSHGDLHLARKAFHVISILVILMCMIFLPRVVSWSIYFLVAMPLLLLDLLRPHFPKLNRFSLKIIGPVIRKHEVRQLSGSSYAILGIGFTYFIFPPVVAQLAVLFLAIGDPTASFFGLLFGKIKLFGKKSLEGALAGIAFCSIAALIYFSLNEFEFSAEWSQLITYSLSCGVIGGVAELIPVFGMDDNLSQPLLSSGLLSLFFFFMGGL